MKKTDLDAMRADLIAALDTVAATHGLTMSLGGMTYDSDGFRVKITAHRGSAEDAERAEFERYAPRFGVTAAHFGYEFTLNNGKQFRLIGFRPSAPKRPVVGRSSANGKKYIFTSKVLSGITTNKSGLTLMPAPRHA